MARARKDIQEILVEEKATDVEGLIAFLEKLRAGIPQEVRDSLPDDILTNLDHYLYGSVDPK